MVETLVVMCKDLNTVFICIYRPPATNDDEWSKAIEHLNEQIELVQ